MATTTTTESINIPTPTSVSPEEIEFNMGETFTQSFTFFSDEEGAVNLSGVDVALDLKSFSITPDPESINTTVDIQFDEEVSERIEEGIIYGNFRLEWDTNKRKYPIVVYTFDVESNLPIQRLRRALQDLTAEHRIHGINKVFSNKLLLESKVEAVEIFNSSPGRHRTYKLKSIPDRFVHSFSQGAMGEAMIRAANSLGLNQFPYDAGGVSVQADEARLQYLADLGMRLKDEFQQWVYTQQYYDAMSKTYQQIG